MEQKEDFEYSVITTSLVVKTSDKEKAANIVKDAVDGTPDIHSMQIESNSITGHHHNQYSFNPFDLVLAKRLIRENHPSLIVVYESEITNACGSISTLFFNGMAIAKNSEKEPVDILSIADSIRLANKDHISSVLCIGMTDKILAESIAISSNRSHELSDDIEFLTDSDSAEDIYENYNQGYNSKDLFKAVEHMVDYN